MCRVCMHESQTDRLRQDRERESKKEREVERKRENDRKNERK